MPSPWAGEPVFAHDLQNEVYAFLCKKQYTYLEGAAVFGFTSRQAMHRWLTHGSPRGIKNWERVEQKMRELEGKDE